MSYFVSFGWDEPYVDPDRDLTEEDIRDMEERLEEAAELNDVRD